MHHSLTDPVAGSHVLLLSVAWEADITSVRKSQRALSPWKGNLQLPRGAWIVRIREEFERQCFIDERVALWPRAWVTTSCLMLTGRGSQRRDRGLNTHPQEWKSRVLTAELLGNSPRQLVILLLVSNSLQNVLSRLHNDSTISKKWMEQILLLTCN